MVMSSGSMCCLLIELMHVSNKAGAWWTGKGILVQNLDMMKDSILRAVHAPYDKDHRVYCLVFMVYPNPKPKIHKHR